MDYNVSTLHKFAPLFYALLTEMFFFLDLFIYQGDKNNLKRASHTGLHLPVSVFTEPEKALENDCRDVRLTCKW